MLKNIGAVVAGYIVMFVLVFVTFSAAYLAMGAEGAFKTGSYEVTALWLAVSFVLSFIAALGGGFVCAAIAQNPKATLALAGLVLVLGLLLAIPVLTSQDNGAPQIRDSSVGNLQAMQYAKQPAWVAVLNPILGAVGVMLGARLKK